MAKDYKNTTGRTKKKKNNNSFVKILMIILLLIIIVLSFYLFKILSSRASHEPVLPPVNQNTQQNKKIVKIEPALPPLSSHELAYIKELEKRRIDGNSKVEVLSEEQRKILKEFNENKKFIEPVVKEEKTAETLDNSAKNQDQLAQVISQIQDNNKNEIKPTTNKVVENSNKNNTSSNQITSVVNNQQTKQTKPVDKANTVTTTNNITKNERKYGLQCGSFSNKPAAENLANKISTLGYNMNVRESGKFFRVLSNPIGDRTTTINAKNKISSIASCIVLAM